MSSNTADQNPSSAAPNKDLLAPIIPPAPNSSEVLALSMNNSFTATLTVKILDGPERTATFDIDLQPIVHTVLAVCKMEILGHMGELLAPIHKSLEDDLRPNLLATQKQLAVTTAHTETLVRQQG